MSDEDRTRWDSRWGQLAGQLFSPHPLLIRHKNILNGGIALDLACGLGQNSIWLAENGYNVLASDISGVALAKAMSGAFDHGVAEQLLFTQIKLRYWSFAEGVFDLICVFRYLERDLYPGIHRGLKYSGLLFYGTRHLGVLKSQPQANRKYLLQPGELLEVFGQWDVIYYKEGLEDAQLIARKR